MDFFDMGIDVLAGLSARPVPVRGRHPKILVFDSGVGGLTVAGALRSTTPGAELIYLADDAVFPYGALDDEVLLARVLAVIGRTVEREKPDLVVIACITASTLVLPLLRAALPIPVVGTVPAIKPAVARSTSRRIAVLATAGTIRRAYTAALVEQFAGDCEVRLVAAPKLAGLAEQVLRGEAVPDSAFVEQTAPCFSEEGNRRTDVIVLACTHFPLVIDRLSRAAPWPVEFLDPAPAIARRAASLLTPAEELDLPPVVPGRAIFTAGRNLSPDLVRAFAARGFADAVVEPLP